MDHASTLVLDAIDLVPQTLLNAPIFGDADHEIGRVSHVHGLGAATMVVIEVGGKSVQMPVTGMTFVRDDDGKVHGRTSLSKAEVEALPEHGH